MDAAASIFTDDVVYDDTAFPDPLVGKSQVQAHLYRCANVFPPTFTFQVDSVVSGKSKNAVRWHVENGGENLPFTRGCSFYKLDASGLIAIGLDFVEPGPVKTGRLALILDTSNQQLPQEPARLIPLASWLAYMYIVFFSNGILPGANALVLEQRTWEEVLNLSLNFFLVAPLLDLSFSPTVHPMLEGVFNLLLSWAALFAGFLSDDRKDKPNILPMLPIVVGMQFLTSAFLLPYLATRSTEQDETVTTDSLPTAARLCESRLLGPILGFVGTGSIYWFFAGRPEFGGLLERWSSFIDLLSIDRVGSSFIVDLAIFGLSQGWLVDDDVKRRGGAPDWLVKAGKYVPFFGMAAYLTLRPSLQKSSTMDDS
jgi:SnoaL-like domain